MHTTLKTARERAGLTQQQLADLAGVDKGTISRLEGGRIANPSIDTVTKLEQHLKLRRGERLAFGVHDEAVA